MPYVASRSGSGVGPGSGLEHNEVPCGIEAVRCAWRCGVFAMFFLNLREGEPDVAGDAGSRGAVDKACGRQYSYKVNTVEWGIALREPSKGCFVPRV